jgi:hypothetical protein
MSIKTTAPISQELNESELEAVVGGMNWDSSDRRSTNVDDSKLRAKYAKDVKERAEAGPDFAGFGNFGA